MTQPRDHLTVPARDRCNEGTKLDDEYFRMTLAQGSSHARAQDLMRLKVHPKIAKWPATAELLFRSVGLEVVDDGSGAARYSPTVRPDWLRLTNVVNKITRGLHWFHTGCIVPADCEVVITPAPSTVLNGLLDDDWWDHVGKYLHPGRYHSTSAAETYTYLYVAEPRASIWLHLFFQQNGFIARVAPSKLLTDSSGVR